MSLHEDLKAYLDGELDPVRAEEVKVALERDPGLRRELSELRSLSEHLQSAAAEIRINGLEKTLAALEKSDRSRRLSIERLLWGGGLAIAAAFVGAMLFPVFSQAKSAAKKTYSASLSSSAKASGDVTEALKAEAPAVAATPSAQGFDGTKALKSITRQPTEFGMRDSIRGNAKQKVGRNDNKPDAGITLSMPSRVAQAKATQKAASAGQPASITLSRASVAGGTAAPNSVVIKQVPTTVTLSFASKDDGIKQVLGVVGKYRVPQPAQVLSDKSGKEPTLGEPSTGEIMVEIPEDQADQVIGDLKRLGLVHQPIGHAGMVMARGKAAASNGVQVKAANTTGTVSLSATAPKTSRGNLAKRSSSQGTASDSNLDMNNSNVKKPEANVVDSSIQKNNVQHFATKNSNIASNVSNSASNLNSPKMRLLRIVIEEKPKNDPVP